MKPTTMHDKCTTAREWSGYSHGKDEEQQRGAARQNGGDTNIAHQKLRGSWYRRTILSYLPYCSSIKYIFQIIATNLLWVAISFCMSAAVILNVQKKYVTDMMIRVASESDAEFCIFAYLGTNIIFHILSMMSSTKESS